MSKFLFKNYPQITYQINKDSSIKIGNEYATVLTIYGLDNSQHKQDTSTNIDEKTIIDISKLFKIKDLLKSNIYIYYPYIVRDGETPESIANMYYEDPYLFWLVLLSNNIINPYSEWPLTSDGFLTYIDTKYSNIQSGTSGFNYANNTYYYYTGNGYLVDYTTWLSLTGDQAVDKYQTSYYDHEFTLNEAKRSIKLVGKQYLSQILREVSQVLY